MDNFRVGATVSMTARALGWILRLVSEAYYDRKAALGGPRRAHAPPKRAGAARGVGRLFAQGGPR